MQGSNFECFEKLTTKEVFVDMISKTNQKFKMAADGVLKFNLLILVKQILGINKYVFGNIYLLVL